MLKDHAKLMYYIQVCKEGAAFARSEKARIAFREALEKLKEYITE